MNQNPEQQARDRIDQMLLAAGWAIQSKTTMDFSASLGVAVREYTTSVGPADYVLFVDGKPVGIIEAKKEDEGYKISVVEDQSEVYANSKLQHIKGKQPLPFIYESTGTITRFRDTRDPSPRSREVFSFFKPATLQKWLKEGKTVRSRLLNFPPLPKEGLRDCQFKAIANLEVSFKDNRPRVLYPTKKGVEIG
jgi:type I restriction enzyme R subunit